MADKKLGTGSGHRDFALLSMEINQGQTREPGRIWSVVRHEVRRRRKRKADQGKYADCLIRNICQALPRPSTSLHVPSTSSGCCLLWWLSVQIAKTEGGGVKPCPAGSRGGESWLSGSFTRIEARNCHTDLCLGPRSCINRDAVHGLTEFPR